MLEHRTQTEKILIEALETILDVHIHNLLWNNKDLTGESRGIINMIDGTIRKSFKDIGHEEF